jgi:hypothetical protein
MALSIEFQRSRIERYRRVLEASVCVESLHDFFEPAWRVINPSTQLQGGPHVEAMCKHIQWQLEDRDHAMRDPAFTMRAQNLLINIPPRCLKTTVLVVATVWCWLRWPSMKILYLSTNPRVAHESARTSRDLIQSAWFQATFEPPWQIREDQEALLSFGNTAGGSRASRGLESKITGEGADWICIDDPHDMADTDNEIGKTVERYDSTVANRINDPRTSIRTAIMQRFRDFDFSGHALGTAP